MRNLKSVFVVFAFAVGTALCAVAAELDTQKSIDFGVTVAQFGDEYRQYKARTPGFIPHLGQSAKLSKN